MEKEILLVNFQVAGTTHLDLTLTEKSINEGDKLFLLRESQNPYDRNAILVLNRSGAKLGYVPMVKNELVANMLDNGVQLSVRLKYKEWKGKSYLILGCGIYFKFSQEHIDLQEFLTESKSNKGGENEQ